MLGLQAVPPHLAYFILKEKGRRILKTWKRVTLHDFVLFTG
jgi:hypothetical protein